MVLTQSTGNADGKEGHLRPFLTLTHTCSLPLFSYTALMKLHLLALTSFLIAACGNQPAADDSEFPSIRTDIPKVLEGARLVFGHADGVYLQEAGSKRPTLIVPGATWPRWSPDGSFIAYLKDKGVHRLILETGEHEKLADVGEPRTLVVSFDGKEVWFSDGSTVKAVHIGSKSVRKLAEDGQFLEIDAGPEGKTLLATVRRFGYRVKVFDLESGEVTDLGRGCSASFSPDGKTVTNNLDGHRFLALIDWRSGETLQKIPAPMDSKADNQFWSNHPDWIISMDESDGAILGHRVSDHQIWRLSTIPKGDRPDLWIPTP